MALKFEMELAFRVTVDMSRPVHDAERPMLERTLALAKDISAMRGISDPVIGRMETHLLGALPRAEEAEAHLTSDQVSERRKIQGILAESHSFSDAARRLQMPRASLIWKLGIYGITHQFSRHAPKTFTQ